MTSLSKGTQSYRVTGILISAAGILRVNRVGMEAAPNINHNSSDSSLVDAHSFISLVPEPPTLVMIGTGLLVVAVKARQKLS